MAAAGTAGHSGVMTNKTSCQGHGLDGFYEALRRPGITRTGDGRWFAGVAAGLARRLGVDPLVVRAAFILFGLFFGMGIALYLVGWLLMPDEKGKLPIEAALKYGDGGSIFLLVIAGLSLFGGGPWWNGHLNGLRVVGLVGLVAVVWWFLTQTHAGRDLLKPGSQPGTQEPTTPAQSLAPSVTPGVSTGNAAAAAGVAGAGTTHEPAPVWNPGSAAYGEPLVRVRAIGFASGLLVLGLATLTGALVLSIANAAGWSGSRVGLACAAALAALGLGLVVAGLTGRRAGWLAPFALMGIAATLVTLVVPKEMTVPFHVGNANYTVTSLTGDNRYQNGIGNLRVDLSAADHMATPGRDVVHTTLGIGQLDLVVPQGVSVVVHAQARAGDLRAIGANETGTTGNGNPDVIADGVDWAKTVTYGSGQPEIEVYAEVGAGQINVTAGSAP